MKYSKIEKIALSTLMLILAGIGSSWAQNVALRGKVVDAENGEAMPFVNVGIMRAADTIFMRGTATGMDGQFTLEVSDTMPYLLSVHFVGYQPVILPLHDYLALSDRTIALQRGSTLTEVQVVAERPIYSMDGEKNLYNTKEDLSVQSGTASDALQNAPGVEVDAEGNITLRGVSSVEIWINDRPSHMQAEALKQYIKTMPAGAIERIEVITNPSARYSTSGGVINIVTNQKVTRNELLCVGLRGRTTPSISPWLSYVYANEKFDMNLYVSGDYSRHISESDGSTVMLNEQRDTARLQQFSDRGDGHYWNSYVGGNFNWTIDSMTTLSSWFGAYPGGGLFSNEGSYTHLEYLPTLVDQSRATSSNNRNLWGGGYLGAWFEHRYDTTGRKLHANFNGNLWGGRNRDNSVETFANPALTTRDRHSRSTSFSPSGELSVGYLLPLKHNIELDMGISVDYDHSWSVSEIDSLNLADSIYYPMKERNSTERYSTTSLETYFTAQKRWGNFTAKLGLRAEDEMLRGNTTNDLQQPHPVDTSFVGLVPSVHLSYRTADFHNFSLSYTRRHSTPDAEQLTEFVGLSDYSYTTGNPLLRTSYTHNVEAAWSKFFMQFGSIGLQAYYRANTDQVGSLTDVGPHPYLPGVWVNYTKPVNIGSSHIEGLEANVTYRPSAFLNVRLNASVYNYGYQYDYRGEDVKDNLVTYNLRLNVWAKLWGKLEVFANGYYSSPQLSLYSRTNPRKSIDLGCSADFLDHRLSLYANVSDIFGWSEWGSNSTNPYYTTTGSTRFNSRAISLGLTWRIGKMELEGKARQGATESNGPQGM